MPSTAEYWDVDGTSLNELTQNLISWGGSREEPAPLRGGNTTVPYRAGAVWAEKVPDERQVVLEGWMTDKDPRMLRTRWRVFRALLWRPEEQFLLTRRWYDAAGVLQSGVALAEYKSGLEPVMTGQTRLEFKVTLNLPDPFFYGPQLAVPVPVGDSAFVPKGDYPSTRLVVEFANAQTGMALSALVNGAVDNTLTYSSTVNGAVASVNVDTFRATELLSGATTKTSSKVGHSGRAAWFWLPRKTTGLRFARTSGTGTATLKYQPAWH